ncbi:MAG: sigma-54-dependent transcriptional regulator [Armatimonadota bacterium]
MAAPSPTVLIVDDDPQMLQVLVAALDELDCYALTARDGASALEAADGAIDLLILDRLLPDVDGVELLGQMRARGVTAPAIIVTAHPTVETAIGALGHQAVHYLPKPLKPAELLERVRAVLGFSGAALHDAQFLWQALRERYGFDHVLSASAAVQRAYAVAARVADTSAPVLLEGETGVGKDYLARAIHYMSGRAERQFVAVNCGALPDQLLVSELFGHEKGAFTSATQAKKGLCEVAHRGTLFLDEIGEMSRDSQVKLLHFTQDRTFTRLGGTQPIEVDVRIICATNQDLARAVADGRFREDLYYRLAVVPLYLPPLRERPTDVKLFARFFLSKHRRLHGRGPRTIAHEALEVLCAQSWPGNLRQLENAIQRGLLLAEGDVLRPEHLMLSNELRATSDERRPPAVARRTEQAGR